MKPPAAGEGKDRLDDGAAALFRHRVVEPGVDDERAVPVSLSVENKLKTMASGLRL